jgi:S-adenosylmethionine-dependent methyltransferase
MLTRMVPGSAFDRRQAAWAEHVATPWARIRYAVVRKTLADSLVRLGTGRLRILDVGGGDAVDCLPLAAAGHDVTVLDPSEAMLAGARHRASAAGQTLHTVQGGIDDLDTLGQFDAVLCHFVLQYREDIAADIARLVNRARPGGLLSIIGPNSAGYVLTRLLRQGPGEALAELGRDTARTVTFDCEVHKIEFPEIERNLVALGCRVVGRYGGRIANDLIMDDAAKHDPEFYSQLERLELTLCDKEPFWRIGKFWQAVAQRSV